MTRLQPASSEAVFAAAELKARQPQGKISRVLGCRYAPFDPGRGPERKPGILAPDDMVGLAGAYLYLCRFSKPHEQYQYCLLENRILPSFEWDSYRLYFVDEVPVAYISWNWVTDAVDERLRTGESALRADDWNRGDNFWFMEVLAPFGHIFEVMVDLHENVFTAYPNAKATYLAPNGKVMVLREFYNFENNAP